MSTVQGDRRSQLGRDAEAFAAEYLVRTLGWTVRQRNWRNRFGELDIVAQDADTLVVVEVRARSGDEFGPAKTAVDVMKARRIVRLVPFLIAEMGWGASDPVRFDVITMRSTGRAFVAVDHVRNAFDGSV